MRFRSEARQDKAFFFEKKKQKTFPSAVAGPSPRFGCKMGRNDMGMARFFLLSCVLGMFVMARSATCQAASPVEGPTRVDGASVSDVRSFLNHALVQPPTHDQTRALLLRNKIGELTDPNDGIQDEVCAEKIINVGPGQEPALVAIIGRAPRIFCESFIIVRVLGDAVYETDILGLEDDEIETEKDVLPGQTLLVVSIPLTYYAGASGQASVPHLYEFSNNSVKDVSTRFPGYYAAMLDSPAAARVSNDPNAPDRTLLAKIEIAATQSLAGRPVIIQPLADELSASPNPNMREKAVALFQIAKGKASIARLRAFTHDPSPSVALAAKFALQDIGTYGK
jgi:hypothetical protein